MACMMYADDILLISASLAGLQELLDECVLISNEICLKFNEKKSHCIIVGPISMRFVAKVMLGGTSLMWENSIKYLGIDLMAGSSFDVDLDQVRRKFFVSANSILRHCTGASELIKLYLCESFLSSSVVLCYCKFTAMYCCTLEI